MSNQPNGFFSTARTTIGKQLKGFFGSQPEEPAPPSATIENRTAWRIVISHVNTNGRSEARAPKSAPIVASTETAPPLFQDLPVSPARKRESLGAPRPAAKDQSGGRDENESSASTPAATLNSPPHDRLILAPFAKRLMACEFLDQYDYQSWEKRGFVQVRPTQAARADPGFAKFVRVVAWVTLTALLLLTLIASPIGALFPKLIATLVPTPIVMLVTLSRLWAQWPYWLALFASAGVVWYFDGAAIGKWLAEALDFLVVVLISLLLSLGFFIVITHNPSLSTTLLESSVTVQAGIAVIFFVVLASSIPALLYYIFERQTTETTRAIFLRDIIRLNPSVYTLDEAEFRYGALADEVYGHKASQDFLGGLQLSLLVNLALTTLGWSLALMPNVGHLPSNITPYDAVPLLITPLRHPIVFGALGSYFFALNMLFRRYVRSDLSAKAYTHVVIRQLTTVVLVWAVSGPTQLWANLGPSGQDALLVLSFFIGIVPETALAALQDYLRNLKVLNTSIPSLYEDQPLDDLEGVTLYDRARLLEEGIENVENLAHHNMIDLILRAHLPTPRVADLVDQAILYLHLYEPRPPAPASGLDPANAGSSDAKSDAPKLAENQPANGTTAAAGSQRAVTLAKSKSPVNPAAANQAGVNPARAILRRYGIRTATDLEHARDLAGKRGQTELDQFLALLDGEGQTPGRLQTVLDALEDDDWMPYLREWHWNRRLGLAKTLDEIEKILLGRPTAKENQDPPAKEIRAAPSKASGQVTAAAEPATALSNLAASSAAMATQPTPNTDQGRPAVIAD